MKILALWRLTDNADMDEIVKLLEDEERYAWNNYLSGVLREHYESDLPVPAISIIEADDIEHAKELFKNLPIMKAGYLEPQYYPLQPFKNWDVLFKDEFKV